MVIVDINPIFGKADFTIDDRLAFVLMPFRQDLTQIYETYIKPTVEGKNLQCLRADDFKSSTKVMEDIWRSIYRSRVIIADLTDTNANVMYELGIAHTLGKDTILIYQKGDTDNKFPFDLAYIRRIEYQDKVIDAKKLISSLSLALSEILSKEAHNLSDEILNTDLKRYLQSEYIRHKKRVDYFSHHSLYILKEFREEHVNLLSELDDFMKERSEQSKDRIMAISCRESDRADHYISPFIKSQLDKVEDYLDSAWLVNKFPDELSMIGNAMHIVRNSKINVHTEIEDLQHMKEIIEDRIVRIQEYIEIIGEERKAIGLS